ncbi:unnamed protein product [Bursaphelenchus xylophilus]|uniref:(pine wood nematode) hypothetical protein n=1 Tax=Bursaphelenchus xylophilus TaxID=6326 RepID=A0A811KIU6_BURXY|nr:unnamed protein product [Bursaphelenchus xylophilus]CAG9095653.1 unnamed protein product [Bursaphelenchus xylophilus]
MGFCTQFLLALLILAKFDQAFCGTWLSFSTSNNQRRSNLNTELANLADGSADRLALSNSVPVQPNGDPGRPIGADPLEVLLSSCNENYMTRAQRSEAPKSDVLRLCKALLESMQQ